MLAKIFSSRQLDPLVEQLAKLKKGIVLVGGCFDVLHMGHVVFLQKAKHVGDTLVVLLESDQRIKKLKGQTRPIHNQAERAQILAALEAVDYIVCLPTSMTDRDYDQIVSQIKPQLIAITDGDAGITQKQRVASLIGAKIKEVTKKVGNYSTTQFLKDLSSK